MQFYSAFYALYSVCLCFFGKLQGVIAQLDLVLFASSHNKKKPDDNLTNRSKYESINSPRCHALWLPGKEKWVLLQLGSQLKCVERPVWVMFPDYLFLETMLSFTLASHTFSLLISVYFLVSDFSQNFSQFYLGLKHHTLPRFVFAFSH